MDRALDPQPRALLFMSWGRVVPQLWCCGSVLQIGGGHSLLLSLIRLLLGSLVVPGDSLAEGGSLSPQLVPEHVVMTKEEVTELLAR